MDWSPDRNGGQTSPAAQEGQPQPMADYSVADGDEMLVDDASPAPGQGADTSAMNVDDPLAGNISYASEHQPNLRQHPSPRRNRPSPTKGPPGENISRHPYPPPHPSDVHQMVGIMTNCAIADTMDWDPMQISTVKQIEHRVTPAQVPEDDPRHVPRHRLQRINSDFKAFLRVPPSGGAHWRPIKASV
ncbi:hypothetical protein VKT23_011106 [Stygiomarasmius scandens]|uniref:Uncharacterized protein n=1 Tax=Marasmiellus scandens TaxID=2682957 RepID=A0ABR1J9X0_9AGAR